MKHQTPRPKLVIQRSNEVGYEPVQIKVVLDGKVIAEGGIGGEPEDNCEARDYGWVVPGFCKLAERLGAEVSEVVVPDEDEE